MTPSIDEACVVGAGLAGLASALALVMRGIEVTLVERQLISVSRPAFLEVVPSMLRDLVRLGVGDRCSLAGFAFNGADVADSRGTRHYELSTPSLAGRTYPPALGILHSELRRVLEEAAVEQGVRLLRGRVVAAIEEVESRARVVLDDGNAVAADLVLLASGSGSEISASCFPQSRTLIDHGQRWWYSVVRRPLGLDRPLIAMGGPARRLILVPVRNDLAGIALTEPLKEQEPDAQAPYPVGLKYFDGSLHAMAQRLISDTSFELRLARSGLMERPWYRGPVLAVGACVHALPPHFGQAAAQSVEDACVLGDLLKQTRQRDFVLSAFEQRRYERVRRVHELTTRAARWDVQPDRTTDMNVLMEQLAGTVAVPA